VAENFWESPKIEIETQEARPPGGLSYFWPKKEPMPARAAARQLRLNEPLGAGGIYRKGTISLSIFVAKYKG
jgi:hypothetical protein